MNGSALARPQFVTERRGSPRSKASAEVHLQTAAGNWHGTLWDISETGARVQVARPPIPGATALIRWQENETLCRIIWATEDMCGVQFERPISVTALGEAVQPRDGPRTSLNNIPLGQKRTRPV